MIKEWLTVKKNFAEMLGVTWIKGDTLWEYKEIDVGSLTGFDSEQVSYSFLLLLASVLILNNME